MTGDKLTCLICFDTFDNRPCIKCKTCSTMIHRKCWFRWCNKQEIIATKVQCIVCRTQLRTSWKDYFINFITRS